MSGPKLPSVKREDGDITVSRTIQTPSVSILITGTLTEADRIYRLLAKLLLQNGYKLTHLTKTATALPGRWEPSTPFFGEKDDEVAELKLTIDKLVDESMDLIKQNRRLADTIVRQEAEVQQLQRMQTALEDTLSRITSGEKGGEYAES